jgi:MOSC domain-containing protein YiiM
MKRIGTVVGTFIARAGVSSGQPREKVSHLELIEGLGVSGDKFAGKNLDRTVMIIGEYAYQKAKDEGVDLQSGSYGENILLDFDPHDYQVGDQLVIGRCEIEITEVCSLCNHLSVYDKRLPKIVLGHRGLYCKINQSGMIEKGDTVLLKGKE